MHGAAAVSHAADLALWGHTDTALSARYLLSRLREQTYARRTYLVATGAGVVGDADGVVGLATVIMPTTGNDHAAFVEVLVHPEHRRRGAGRALLAEGERLAREAGRATVISSTEHRGEPTADEAGVLVPPTGSGRIRAADPGAVFAAAHGFALGQAERYSVLELPAEADRLEHLHAKAARAGTAYRTVRWRDRVPDELLDEFALLETRMTTTPRTARSTSARRSGPPSGCAPTSSRSPRRTTAPWWSRCSTSLPGTSSASRWSSTSSTRRAGLPGEHHRAARAPGAPPGDADQVRARGVAATERPGARRVHAWNAEENGHMLAINVALGFRPTGVAGMWQKTLA